MSTCYPDIQKIVIECYNRLMKFLNQQNKSSMNENLNLAKILRDCPRGIKLYSAVHGDVFLNDVLNTASGRNFSITVSMPDGGICDFTKEGKMSFTYDGECVLFPSKDQRDWSLFQPPIKPIRGFNPGDLKPFDKVLVRDDDNQVWRAELFSHLNDEPSPFKAKCTSMSYIMCIPYNDQTKHLVGTKLDCYRFYKWWEE